MMSEKRMVWMSIWRTFRKFLSEPRSGKGNGGRWKTSRRFRISRFKVRRHRFRGIKSDGNEIETRIDRGNETSKQTPYHHRSNSKTHHPPRRHRRS
jgi:hypothetical protein